MYIQKTIHACVKHVLDIIIPASINIKPGILTIHQKKRTTFYFRVCFFGGCEAKVDILRKNSLVPE